MLREMLKSKIHRVKVTEANIDYEGSITIDKKLLELANILPYERVQIADVTNGARLETYAIEGEPGSGTICINGAAAHLVQPDDTIIILSYAVVDEQEAKTLKPKIIYVDENNKVTHVGNHSEKREEC